VTELEALVQDLEPGLDPIGHFYLTGP